MINITFPPHLRRFIDVPEECSATGGCVRDVVEDLESQYPGIRSYLLHENGTLRKHVNLFLDQQLIRDRQTLSDSTDEIVEIVIMQALSGG